MSWMAKWVRMMDGEQLRIIIDNPNYDVKCAILHGGDCNTKAVIQFAMGVKSVFKMYLLAHIVPFLLFKLRKFR
jgi:hypothetical protein